MSSLADYFTNQIRVQGFDALFDRCVREIGMDPDGWSPTGMQFELICDYMSERFLKGYEHDWWPLLCPVVAREVVDNGRGKYVPFLQEYSTAGNLTVSGAGLSTVNGVYEPDGTVNSKVKWTLTDADGETVAYVTWDGAADWEIYDADATLLYSLTAAVDIPVSAAWSVKAGGTTPGPVTDQFYEPMDAIRDVTRVNPRLAEREPAPVDYRLSNRGIELPQSLEVDVVWVEFRLRPPRVTRVAYAGGTTYKLDDVVYDSTTGECYRSLRGSNVGNAVTDGLWWEKQFLPALFSRYIPKGVAADWARTHGDSEGFADRESGRAAAELDRISDVARPQQRQIERARAEVN